MEIQSNLRKLTTRQQTALAKAFVRLRKNELKCSNDSYIAQLVLTKYNKHWFCTFYQTLDDVIEGRWSMSIASIEGMVVDMLHGDTPMMTNVNPMFVYSPDGTIYEVQSSDINTDAEEDIEDDN